MSCKILFVVCEVGSAKYCLPLWNRWFKKKNNSFDWKILTFKNIVSSCKLEKFSKHLISRYDFEKSFVDNLSKIRWNPSIIFSSSSYKNIEFESLLYAYKNNVLGIQFLDTWYNYFARLAKKNNKVLASKVCVIDQSAYLEAYKEGVGKEILNILGQPALEKIKYKKKNKK